MAEESPPTPPDTGLEDEEPDARIDEALADLPQADVSRSRALNDEEAGRVSSVRRSTVVVLAGEVGSGKTTLLTALYERFGRGPVAGRLFAGSQTLPGFEARCWGLRAGSGRTTPAMPHTHREALPWLHLRVSSNDGVVQDLLLGDFDGEIFGDIIDGKAPARTVPALRRADHLAIVIDGESLVDPVRRHVAVQRALDLLAALGKQREAIADPKVITLVLTKQDAVDTAGRVDQEAVQEALEVLRTATRDAFDDYLPAVVSTAAISRIEELPLGHGLDELLDLWSRQPLIQIVRDATSTRSEPAPGDWFARFMA
jgi:hypothetical protein